MDPFLGTGERGLRPLTALPLRSGDQLVLSGLGGPHPPTLHERVDRPAPNWTEHPTDDQHCSVARVNPRRWSLGATVVAVLMVALLTGCSGGSSTVAGSPAVGVAATDPLGFSGTTLDGATLDAATLTGTPVVLWFWAPWCTICRAEAPDVSAVAAQYQGRVRVVGIPGRGEIAAMRAFVSETGTDGFTHVEDVDGALWNRFGVVAQPAFVFVDRAGKAQTFAGSLDAAQLRTMFDRLA